MKIGGVSILLPILIAFSLSIGSFTATEAYDQKSNVTIKWDVFLWTPDGYVAVVTIYNFQHERHINAPGWRLGWTWRRKEVIWNMVGSRALPRGDCSRFKGNVPSSCSKTPTIMDLKPGTPFSQQIGNCCKGGVLTPWFQQRANSISAFQITVGQAGNTNRTVQMPIKSIFKAPQDLYTCGPSKIVPNTRFISADKRRVIQTLMTWDVTCSYSGRRSKIGV